VGKILLGYRCQVKGIGAEIAKRVSEIYLSLDKLSFK